MRIAVDAMGGDHAPSHTVSGAVLAVRELGAEVVLVGRQADVEAELAQHGVAHGVEVVHADDVIGMDESPAIALRRKRNSSLHVAARLLRDGDVQGLVSAGNTGAVMVTVKTLVGTLIGVDRPAIAAVLPSVAGHTVVLDVGANVDPKERQFMQFAVMGTQFSRVILGVEAPKVGLLSVGEEAGKGNELIRLAHRQLDRADIRFVGNVEARDIFNGKVDVVVCDGFTGNIVLKTSEATVETLGVMLNEELVRSVGGRIGTTLAKPAFNRFKKRVDWAEFGGAPLLGARGLCVICHGRSNPRAIMNGVRVALEFGEHEVDRRIEQALAATPETGESS